MSRYDCAIHAICRNWLPIFFVVNTWIALLTGEIVKVYAVIAVETVVVALFALASFAEARMKSVSEQGLLVTGERDGA